MRSIFANNKNSSNSKEGRTSTDGSGISRQRFSPSAYDESAIFDMSEDESDTRNEVVTQDYADSPSRRPDHLRNRVLGSALNASPMSASVTSSPFGPAKGSPLPQRPPNPHMRASWLTDSFVLSRRQSIAESLNGSIKSGTSDRGRPEDSFIEGNAPLVEIFQYGDRLGPGLMHDGHPIKIAHTSEGFRAQDHDDSGSQLEVLRKLGEGSYAVVYLVREIISLPPSAQSKEQQQHSLSESHNDQQADDLDQYSRTLRASESHPNPDSPWASPYPPIRTSTSAKPTGRKFALKCLCKRHLDDNHLEIQRLEATIHQSIGFHPNIVTLYRVYETPDWLFLVLEYCPGQDLYFWLERSQDTAGGLTPAASIYRGDVSSVFSSPSRGLSPKPLPSLHSNEPWDMDEDLENTPPNPSLLASTSNLSLLSRRRLRLVSRMFRQMCDAVQFCHDQGISHRDLKPENFIVEDRRWFFDWEEEEDAYDNDGATQDGPQDNRLSVNLLAATPTTASVFDATRRLRSPDSGPNRPSPSRSVSSANRGQTSSLQGKVVVKLTDFGLATADTQCRDFDCGSKPYMAYECANDDAPYYDAKQADIWSLGVCLLNLIFHRSPFKEPNAQRCESFASFCYDPVKFLTEAFEGLTRDAADFLAQNVFCEINSSKYPTRRRIEAKAFADWVENLPEHMGLGSSDTSRVLTKGPDHSITSPLSHSRAGSFSPYLPLSFEALGLHETVPVEPLPENLEDVELPEELGDSTYIQTRESDRSVVDQTLQSANGGSDGDATVALSKSNSDEIVSASSSGAALDAEKVVEGEADEEDREHSGIGAEGENDADGDTTQRKPRRRKRGARKGRSKKDGNSEPATEAENGTGPVTDGSERDLVIDQLAAASQQLARDISKMRNAGTLLQPSSMSVSDQSSGQTTAVPTTPLDGSIYGIGGPAFLLSNGSAQSLRQENGMPYPPVLTVNTNGLPISTQIMAEQLAQLRGSPLDPFAPSRRQLSATDPGGMSFGDHAIRDAHDNEPMEVMHTADEPAHGRRPLNPGLTQPTSWRERSHVGSSLSSGSNSNSTMSSNSYASDTASLQSAASAPAGFPGPRHRPADLKMNDKVVDVSYLAAIFNGGKDGSGVRSGVVGGAHGANGLMGQANIHTNARASPQTASAPAMHIQPMPSALLRSAAGASSSYAPSTNNAGISSSSARVVQGLNGRILAMPTSSSASSTHTTSSGGSSGSNSLAGARPQWRDHGGGSAGLYSSQTSSTNSAIYQPKKHQHQQQQPYLQSQPQEPLHHNHNQPSQLRSDGHPVYNNHQSAPQHHGQKGTSSWTGNYPDSKAGNGGAAAKGTVSGGAHVPSASGGNAGVNGRSNAAAAMAALSYASGHTNHANGHGPIKNGGPAFLNADVAKTWRRG
ncbi:hypothetical protein OC846_002365 [Tilletia horrida]|uniref:Protein kinase domain-containing protein n=1 Tax=Tilletia horrida TaxID=155126 RepID=A0AAN6GS29_9BASI|nr:hypothetical protein OC845_002495 [Tilletia horrida]KAK0553834.1 hypothetical protein OC846_002365 [Tilletia horrida]KAK0567797.1 hypothetical protein OC861_002540 [Tilletia horrida]